MIKVCFGNLLGAGDDSSSDDEDLDVIEFFGEPPEPPAFQLVAADDPDLQVALIRGFLTPEEVARIHNIVDDPAVKEIDDRDDELVYRHQVWRFENQLKAASKGLYDR